MSQSDNTMGDDLELRRGPWMLEEDGLLMHYIATHGEGRWDMLARCSGLKRTGKSCRLRWLNYLKPDVKRGNLTLEEQVSILELHSKWGNRWSRIARHLPGRTDNEIKNYWRTRVQKHARQLKIDANSPRFRDMIKCFWVPRLVQKIEENSRSVNKTNQPSLSPPLPPQPAQGIFGAGEPENCFNQDEYNSSLETSDSPSVSLSIPEASAYPTSPGTMGNSAYNPYLHGSDLNCLNLDPMSAMGSFGNTTSYQLSENNWGHDEMGDGLWNMDQLWQFTKLEESSI